MHCGIAKRTKCIPQCNASIFPFQSLNVSDLWYFAIRNKPCVLLLKSDSSVLTGFWNKMYNINFQRIGPAQILGPRFIAIIWIHNISYMICEGKKVGKEVYLLPGPLVDFSLTVCLVPQVVTSDALPPLHPHPLLLIASSPIPTLSNSQYIQ